MREPTRSHFGGNPQLLDTPVGPYAMGLMAVVATVTMLFAAFTAALLMRRTGIDWTPVRVPAITWVNTVVLLASSVAVESARHAIKDHSRQRAVRWLATATGLGILFLAGQILAWQALAARGVLLPTNPHAAFFYMLSAIHGAHVVGGLGALVWTTRRTRAGRYATPTHRDGLTHCAIYWHFVGGVWVYLMIVLRTL